MPYEDRLKARFAASCRNVRGLSLSKSHISTSATHHLCARPGASPSLSFLQICMLSLIKNLKVCGFATALLTLRPVGSLDSDNLFFNFEFNALQTVDDVHGTIGRSAVNSETASIVNFRTESLRKVDAFFQKTPRTEA